MEANFPNYKFEIFLNLKTSNYHYNWIQINDPEKEKAAKAVLDFVIGKSISDKSFSTHYPEDAEIVNKLKKHAIDNNLRMRAILEKPFGYYNIKELVVTEKGLLLSFSEDIFKKNPDFVKNEVIVASGLYAVKSQIDCKKVDTHHCFGLKDDFYGNQSGFALKGIDEDMGVYSEIPFYHYDSFEYVEESAAQMLYFLLEEDFVCLHLVDCGGLIEVKEEPGETDEDDYESD